MSLGLRVWIVERLFIGSSWFWDTDTLTNDLFIFRGWFRKGKWLASSACVWFFDRGKPVIRCRSQDTKVVRRKRNRLCKLTTFSAETSTFKQIFKVSQFDARVAKIFGTLCIVLEEGEEDFIPLGIVFFILCARPPFLCQWMENFGRKLVKEVDVVGDQRIPILLF